MNINQLKILLKQHYEKLKSIKDANPSEFSEEFIENLITDIKRIDNLDIEDLSENDLTEINSLISEIISIVGTLKRRTLEDINALNHKSEAIRKYNKY